MRGTMDKHFILHFAPTSMIPAQSTPPHVLLQPEESVNQVLKVAESGVIEPALMVDSQKSWKHRSATAFEKKKSVVWHRTIDFFSFYPVTVEPGFKEQ